MGAESSTVLLVVPPFAGLERPSMGVHLLQACARTAGFQCDVFYANLMLAGKLGDRTYRALCNLPVGWLMGERMMAPFAYGVPVLGHDGGERVLQEYQRLVHGPDGQDAVKAILDRPRLLKVTAILEQWIAEAVDHIARRTPTIVGFTTTFEQTAASVALANAIKRRHPNTITLIGGANCEDEMALGVSQLSEQLDFVFSGESEETFLEFLRAHRAGQLPSERIIHGLPQRDLDSLSTPDYREYNEQLVRFVGLNKEAIHKTLLPFETSRGCWWGEKSHCTFCGLNGQGMAYRRKSPARVIEQLAQLTEGRPTATVAMTDNIMPHEYFKTLLPRISEELPGLRICYEQKSNLTLRHMKLLHAAGVTEIQPGIEALSTELLRLMKKGVTTRQNVMALRYARVFDINVHWNLLIGFPRDKIEYYEQTCVLMPLLRHLQPPSGAIPVVLSRFSPYFVRPKDFGIRDLRPLRAYQEILPASADANQVAYFFDGAFESALAEAPEVRQQIDDEIRGWRSMWSDPAAAPSLAIVKQAGAFLLHDSRALGSEPVIREKIDWKQVRAALAPEQEGHGEALEWAVYRNVIAKLDLTWAPLATAAPDLLEQLEVGKSMRNTTRLEVVAPSGH